MSTTIEITAESPHWERMPGARASIRAAIAAALADCEVDEVEVGVVLADDARVRELNRSWRGKDAPTNVLSFPAPEMQGESPRFLGDIVLAFETIEREAADDGKPVSHHIAHLAVHGALHLLGFDHERDEEAEAMERREREILRRLGIADPYAPARERAAESA
jgi:probable rRNA maturation factor